MRLRFPTGLALAFCSLLVMGHAADAQAAPVQSAAVSPNAPAVLDTSATTFSMYNCVLGPNDKVKISVYAEAGLTRE